MERREDFWFWLIVASLFVAAAILMGSGMARAHDAIPTIAQPEGWKYPWSCCSSQDCQRVGSIDVREPTTVHPSYEIRATGELIAPGDKRIKDSPDGEFHVCAHKAGLDAGRVICLYVPPKGF